MEDINIGNVILWFVVFLFSLSFHEAAHAWTSEKFGDDTGRLQGRITLNPIPHIDPIGTIVFPLLMIFTSIPLLGWAKPVQTNPLLWRDKTKANISVSAAGPISNFILATLTFIVIKVLLMSGTLVPRGSLPYELFLPAEGLPAFMAPLAVILSVMLMLNIALGVFNLIPIPPLDGSHVLESLLPPEMSAAYAQIRPYGFLLLIGLLYLGVFRGIFMPVMKVVYGLLTM
ncbi:MAG: site-2 protease family protein [Blastocatellia bacterium]|nr:site-2 protease family protein [Blastocatellia bacterium]